MLADSPSDLADIETVLLVYIAVLGLVLIFVLVGEAVLRWKTRSPVEKILRTRRLG